MRSDARVHGIITHGGDAVNIIGLASAKFSLRAKDRPLPAAARGDAAPGRGGPAHRAQPPGVDRTRGYDNMVANSTIAELMAENMRATGRKVHDPALTSGWGPPTWATSARSYPACTHISSLSGVANHTVEFTEAAASPAGDRAVLDGAAVLAMTAADLLAEPERLQRAKAEFDQAGGRRQGGRLGRLASTASSTRARP